MNKSLYVHYKNKFPKAKVDVSENSLDVYSQDGRHLLAMRKDGNGLLKCVSEELGLPYKHDLAPIAKDARIHKLGKDGKVCLDEKHEERAEASKSWMEGDEIESQDAYDKRKAAEKAADKSA